MSNIYAAALVLGERYLGWDQAGEAAPLVAARSPSPPAVPLLWVFSMGTAVVAGTGRVGAGHAWGLSGVCPTCDFGKSPKQGQQQWAPGRDSQGIWDRRRQLQCGSEALVLRWKARGCGLHAQVFVPGLGAQTFPRSSGPPQPLLRVCQGGGPAGVTRGEAFLGYRADVAAGSWSGNWGAFTGGPSLGLLIRGAQQK